MSFLGADPKSAQPSMVKIHSTSQRERELELVCHGAATGKDCEIWGQHVLIDTVLRFMGSESIWVQLITFSFCQGHCLRLSDSGVLLGAWATGILQNVLINDLSVWGTVSGPLVWQESGCSTLQVSGASRFLFSCPWAQRLQMSFQTKDLSDIKIPVL
jgi:hypothetical protein